MTAPAPSRVDVSIVIVCMNQLDDLFRCLDAIAQHTHRATCEIWVVAYLFSAENLAKLRARHPAVRIVESGELRGFAENNNLALRQVNGEHCFIVNDDTYMDMPVVDVLLESFRKEPRAAIFSPKILNPDGSVQFCGGLPHTLGHWLLVEFKLRNLARIRSPLVNGTGIFRTGTVMGAAFMVRTAVLRELGYFDERFFFSPEDSALSMLANARGYGCYVNADAAIYHRHSATLGRHALPTVLAMQRGQTLYLSGDSGWRWWVYSSAMFVLAAGKSLYWALSRAPDRAVRARIWRRAMGTAFSRRTPKEIFARHFRPAPVAEVREPRLSTGAGPAGSGRRTWS